MKNYTEDIAKYISGELSDTEKTAFENELKTNPDLKKEYDTQRHIIEGVKRMGLKYQVASSFKKVKQQKLVKTAVTGLIVTLAVLGAILLVKHQVNKNNTELLYSINEQGNSNWSEADKTLPSQVYKINPLRDTIIETDHGIVIAIPALAFLNTAGTAVKDLIDVEVKEAMTPLEIMKAGLSTMSDGKLLETGGMFYVNARRGEENLTVDSRKPLNVNIPDLTAKSDMMLFKGERQADGSLNWIDPAPLNRKLTTVEITSLDFYPAHFLDSLKALGFSIKTKKITDSVYYSFSGYCAQQQPARPSQTDPSDTTMAYSVTSSDVIIENPDGEKLFRENCAVCHSIGKEKVTGPGLANVGSRVPQPTNDWLLSYIKNNNKLITAGDPYTKTLVANNGGADGMPEFTYLSDQEIKSIINYITDGLHDGCEIDPSRIKAIWNKKFNQTILATKAFEERLKVIFTTCDSRILDLYIHNLNKNMYEIDSLAASLLYGQPHDQFIAFYKRRDGAVLITDTQSKQLQVYFEEKRTIYQEAATKAMQSLYEKEAAENNWAFEKKNSHDLDASLRNSKTFNEELNLNMDDAYRQLGKKRPTALPAANYVSATVTQTGWNNVDRYVLESTINRTTLDYKDPNSGKKAIIRYLPITLAISDFHTYDRVISYMIPDRLSSFQVMKMTPTGTKETLNELMHYSVVTIGFKGSSMYYYEIHEAKPQAYTFDLIAISSKDLEKKLKAHVVMTQKTDLLKDIHYQIFDLKNSAREKRIQKRELIRGRLYPVVFPCREIHSPNWEIDTIEC